MKIQMLLFLLLFQLACSNNSNSLQKELTFNSIKTYPFNSSIRALEVINDNTIWFAGSKGQYGYTKDAGLNWHLDSIKTDSIIPHFRAIAHTSEAIFLLSIESPALLYKSIDEGRNWEIVYQEHHPAAFYDAMTFWDDNEGIAMGDPIDSCLSVIITRDGGNNWTKIPCDLLPKVEKGEAAFAASNSNIAARGQHAWIVSGGKKARVFHTADRGKTWEVYDTPITQGAQMTGIFSVDFQDEKNGIIFGGDWEKQDANINNKAVTNDGGKSWQLISDGQTPGYRSCVRILPEGNGQQIVAVGIPGISYSSDGGQHWDNWTEESFYTVRFGNKNEIAWLAGNKKIGKMIFNQKSGGQLSTITTKAIIHPPSVEQKINQSFQKILDNKKLKGAILIYDSKNKTYHSNDFEHAQKGYLPASTFKIPNNPF